MARLTADGTPVTPDQLAKYIMSYLLNINATTNTEGMIESDIFPVNYFPIRQVCAAAACCPACGGPGGPPPLCRPSVLAPASACLFPADFPTCCRGDPCATVRGMDDCLWRARY